MPFVNWGKLRDGGGALASIVDSHFFQAVALIILQYIRWYYIVCLCMCGLSGMLVCLEN